VKVRWAEERIEDIGGDTGDAVMLDDVTGSTHTTYGAQYANNSEEDHDDGWMDSTAELSMR
jgi:hypothetical protein